MKILIVILIFALLITGCSSIVTVEADCNDDTFNYTYNADGMVCSNEATKDGFILRCVNE